MQKAYSDEKLILKFALFITEQLDFPFEMPP